jgi:hypothetical protein
MTKNRGGNDGSEKWIEKTLRLHKTLRNSRVKGKGKESTKILGPWIWDRYIVPKRRWDINIIHFVITQNRTFLITQRLSQLIFKPLHLTELLLRENPIDILIIDPRYDMVFQLTGYIVILTDWQTLQHWLRIIPYYIFNSNFYVQKNSTDNKVENSLISTTYLGLFDRPSSGSSISVESSWNVIAHGEARQGEWRENWWMQWVAATLHTTWEHGVSSITTADAHTSAASSRLNWRPPPN